MTLRVISTGDKHCSLFNVYLKRISWPLENIVVPQRLTGRKYIEKVQSNIKGYLIVLEEKGRLMNSNDFSDFLEKQMEVQKDITMLVGPSDGIPRELSISANMSLSLGPMTYPHELARVLLIEQVYRAQQILKGHPYHRA